MPIPRHSLPEISTQFRALFADEVHRSAQPQPTHSLIRQPASRSKKRSHGDDSVRSLFIGKPYRNAEAPINIVLTTGMKAPHAGDMPSSGPFGPSARLLMSALGHKQTYAVQHGMSALPPRATSNATYGDVRFGHQKRTYSSDSKAKRSLERTHSL